MKNAGMGSLGLLFTFALIIGLTIFAINHYGLLNRNNSDESGDSEKAPIEEAMGMECLMRIEAYKDDIKMFQAEHDRYPESLDELGGDYTCPVTGQTYHYDHETGEIRCPEHG